MLHKVLIFSPMNRIALRASNCIDDLTEPEGLSTPLVPNCFYRLVNLYFFVNIVFTFLEFTQLN